MLHIKIDDLVKKLGKSQTEKVVFDVIKLKEKQKSFWELEKQKT